MNIQVCLISFSAWNCSAQGHICAFNFDGICPVALRVPEVSPQPCQYIRVLAHFGDFSLPTFEGQIISNPTWYFQDQQQNHSVQLGELGFGLQDFFRIPKFFAAAPAATHITSKNTIAYAVTAASKPGEGPRMTTNISVHTFFSFFLANLQALQDLKRSFP